MRAIFRLFILVLFVSLTACGSGRSGGAGFEPSDVDATHDALLSEATGYFAMAGGDGGKGGDIYYVTNLNDSGSGSLRAGAEQSGPLIIAFEDGVDGTINLSDAIVVSSNKTIWGRHRDGSSADIYIDADPSSTAAFLIEGSSRDVIIANLKGDASGPNDSAPDFIKVRGGGNTVWVHHVSGFGDGTGDMDGFVDAVDGGTDITISWCRVDDWQGTLGLRDGAHVTLHHNLWRNNSGRLPKSKGGSMTHNYNNWLDRWRSSAMSAEDGGEILAENNIFDAGSSTDAIHSRGGTWDGSGNVFTNGASTDSPTSVFTPPYTYQLEPIGTAAQAQALRDRLEAGAGWQQ